MKSKVKSYIIAILIPLAVGGLSAFLTRDSMDIYREVATPPFMPPSILFPIVWSVLFILMGISSAMVHNTPDSEISDPKDKERGISVYAVSLAFNFVWSLIFFNARAFFVAFVWLFVLLALIIWTIVIYRRVKPAAAYLQIPYAVWVAFAGYLNFGIAVLN